ncbi:MAG: GNAT family N-acetyltransferase [Jeotgalicoccus sp.]
MDIKHGTNKFYFGDDPQNPDGELTYLPDDKSKLVIDSVVVKEELRGEGLGDVLLDAAADYARENDLRLIGQCPFVAKRFDEYNDKYKDVIFREA